MAHCDADASFHIGGVPDCKYDMMMMGLDLSFRLSSKAQEPFVF
jgi:hypothetical protein